MSWKEELRYTDTCIALDRLGETLNAAEREHLAHCARCQAEMALFEQFEANEARAEDEADVQAIVRTLGARLSRPQSAGVSPVDISNRPRRPIAAGEDARSPVRGTSWTRTFAIAASLIIVVALAYMIQNREPSVNVPAGGESAYRSASVDVIAPKGDVAAAPSELLWTPVAAAKQYDVAVFEVDRTMLWQTSTSDVKTTLPANVAAQCVPGKTILWQVTARRDGTVIAQSGVQRFRVKP